MCVRGVRVRVKGEGKHGSLSRDNDNFNHEGVREYNERVLREYSEVMK